MSFSLYSATIPNYQQALGAVSRLLSKAEAYCAEKSMPPQELLQARLAPDMLPFTYQVKATISHSVGAIEGVRKGLFSPDLTPSPETFDALKSSMDRAIATLDAIEPTEVDSFMGRDMRFAFAELDLPFTAEDFLLSFSKPNFFFHATTAYALLRWKGMPIGKRDFMGRLRIKRTPKSDAVAKS